MCRIAPLGALRLRSPLRSAGRYESAIVSFLLRAELFRALPPMPRFHPPPVTRRQPLNPPSARSSQRLLGFYCPPTWQGHRS